MLFVVRVMMLRFERCIDFCGSEIQQNFTEKRRNQKRFFSFIRNSKEIQKKFNEKSIFILENQ